MRIRKLKQALNRRGCYPYLVSSLVNIRYLTGFTGSSAAMVVDADAVYFITDSRYEEYAQSLLPPAVRFVLQKDGLVETIRSLLKGAGRKALYLEEHSLTLSTFFAMKKELRGVKLLPGGDEVNALRVQKEEGEMAMIRRAVDLADQCFSHILGLIKPGVVEWDLAVEIDYFYRRRGCSGTSFDSIVASGKGSSMPHYATSTTKRIESGDMILIDMGCVYEGYNSDLTRTVFLHKVDPRFHEIYGIVLRAQEAAENAVRPGVTTGALDRKARDLIASEGYGGYFGHSLGHGVGLDVHELPAVKTGGEFTLKKNGVITVEPGIYLPGEGGVRIEDMVLVTSGGREILTKSDKSIIIL